MISQQDAHLIPDESQLINQFARGNGSVFAGAGLSIGAGLPSWEDLMRPLCATVKCPSSTSYLDIAQYYVNVHDEITLWDHIRQELSRPGVAPTGVHRELIKLPVSRIFTTNLDHLLEGAFSERGLRCDRIVTDRDLALMDSGRKSIVKLHGDLDQTASWVLTSEQYETYFSKHPGLANLLGMDLHSRTVLFLGYSFNDFDMRMILSEVDTRTEGSGRSLFAVQFNPTPLEVKEFDRRRIKVIGLRGATREERNRALQQWLEEFNRRVRESPQKQDAALHLFARDFVKSNLPPPPRCLLDRAADRERLMSGLRLRYPLIAIKGFAGVGKTSLAIEAGGICSQSRGACDADAVVFEYVVWVTAKDKPDQKKWLNDVLNEIARTTDHLALTQLPFETQEERDEKGKRVSQLLGSYKILLIIDNFETIDDQNLIDWLEQLPYPSKAIITGRSRLERIAAWSVNLGGLNSGEAAELLRQHEPLVEGEEDQTRQDLVRVTNGNPQAIKLALGLVRGRVADLKEVVQLLETAGGKPEKTFQVLFSLAWEKSSQAARRILLATPLFVGVSSIREEALAAVAGPPFADFQEGLDRCREISLLEEVDERKGYVIHPKTRELAREQLDKQSGWKDEAKLRCTRYFLDLVRQKVVRPQPDQPYWNALVGYGMDDLDPEWPSILQVMAWADEDGQEDVLVELLMLLVHYMDSRFKNLERLKYVQKAVAVLHRQGRSEEEALLRIDALGWTCVEELKLDEAYDQIYRGYEMAKGKDLQALGLAWRARVRVERRERDFERADQLIKEALAIECSPWIRFRVNMAAGDIELKRGDRNSAKAALEFYQHAEREADSYGKEGGGYQTKPRIGLAYLEMGEIAEAERKFKELSDLDKIPIARLYAEYGLALVEREKGHQSEALLMLNDIKAKIYRYTKSNLLLRLIEEQEARMEGSQAAGT
ncbi:MAG: LuxR family transcriptional regulator, glucitol operon activator [Acidobacteriota bacterium]|jgi:hypothetical protein|nr:LuxR family transcriptional regulator, glucitol operon activator [Acidobacteriota bacterium]